MDVGDLENSRLDRLDLVAEPRRRHHHDRVRCADHVDFVLADADGFDQHQIETGGVEHVDGIQRRRRQAALRAAGRHRADEHAGIARDLAHSHPIAEDRSP